MKIILKLKKKKNAYAGLFFGILSIPIAAIPLIGFILAVLGTIFSVNGRPESKKLSVAGLIISIFGIILAVINMLLGIFLSVSLRMPF